MSSLSQFITEKKDHIKFDPLALFPKIKNERPLQFDAFQKIEALFKSDSKFRGLLISLATGYGKSNVGMYATEIARQKILEIINKITGIYCAVCVPLRALAYDHAKSKWGRFFPTLTLTGDKEDKAMRDHLFDPEYEVAIMTFDLLFQYVINQNRLLQQLKCLVIDEAHMLGDKERGWKIEVMMNLIQKFYPQIKIILLSATIGNPNAFADHFQFDTVIGQPSDRPVPLRKFVHPIPAVRKSAVKVEYYKDEIKNIMNKYFAEGYTTDHFPNFLFFCTTVNNTWLLSRWFNETYKKFGFVAAVHNGPMNKKARNQVENDFRDGKLKFVFCTTTLSMGIDMPCDVCVLCGEVFFIFLKKKEKLIDGSQIVQIGGRAGRDVKNGILRESE